MFILVLVLESKSLLLLSFSAPGTCNRIRIRLKDINEYCFTDYPVRKRTVETKPINSDLTHMRVFRPRESLLCQQTTSTYKVAEATKMFWWKSHPQKLRLEWVTRSENSRLSLDLRCLNQSNRSFPSYIFYIPITSHCIIKSTAYQERIHGDLRKSNYITFGPKLCKIYIIFSIKRKKYARHAHQAWISIAHLM